MIDVVVEVIFKLGAQQIVTMKLKELPSLNSLSISIQEQECFCAINTRRSYFLIQDHKTEERQILVTLDHSNTCTTKPTIQKFINLRIVCEIAS